uniref:Rab-GAP TBC domain-containing protein n=1 Tax=Mesocestoides corti TaxID=53468 RepID=A0A5K3EYI5_MESCO
MQTYGFEDPDFVPKDVYADFQKSYEVVLKRRYARWKLVIDQDSLVRGFQRRARRVQEPCLDDPVGSLRRDATKPNRLPSRL